VLQPAAHEKTTYYPLPGLPGFSLPGVRTPSQRSGTRFPYTSIKMELVHEKPDVSFGEIVYEYGYENEYDCVITQAKSPRPSNRDASTEPRGPSAQLAGTDRNVRATACGA
jgi:hypothetical protein